MLSNKALRNRLCEVTRAVSAVGDPDRVEEARGDKVSNLRFLAVRVPKLRSAVKQGFDFYNDPPGDVLATWDYIWWMSPHYEVMAAAIIYYQEVDRAPPAVFPIVRRWAAKVENWGHSDGLAALFAAVCEKSQHQVYPALLELSVAESRWLRRIAVVSCVLGLRRGAFSLPLTQVWSVLDNVANDRDYYVAKAVAWVLREAMRANASMTLDYLRRNRPNFSPAIRGRALSEFRRAFPNAEWLPSLWAKT